MKINLKDQNALFELYSEQFIKSGLERIIIVRDALSNRFKYSWVDQQGSHNGSNDGYDQSELYEMFKDISRDIPH